MADDMRDPMDAFEEPTSWPKVIGIISMVWGGLSLTCAGCGVFGAIASVSMMPEQMKSQGLPPGMGVNATMVVSTTFGALMAFLLFAAGLMTLRRSMAGRMLHLIWSVISILWIPVALFLLYQQDAAMKQWLADNPNSEFAKQPGAGSNIGMMIGASITLLFSLYPAFILIWFLFIKKTKESFGAEAVKDYI